MSIAFIAGLAVLALIVFIAITRRAGPRVAHIETHREVEDEKKNPDA
jgi:hypothetical protein